MTVERVAKDLASGGSKAAAGECDGRTGSTLGAGFNCYCTLVGTGLLQVAYGVAQTGWLGAGVFLAMGVMSGYTAITLIRCVDLIRSIQVRDAKVGARSAVVDTYGDIGEAAFGRVGKWCVELQMHCVLVMVSTIYNMLAGLNLLEIAPSSWDEWLTPELSTILCSLIMWLHVFLKTLGEVAAVSAVNAIITTGLAVVVMVEALRHPPAESPHTTLMVPDIMKVGTGFASFCMAFSVHAVLPTVHRSMKKPEEFSKMIKGTFAVVLCVTLPMLTIGYSMYGDQVHSPIYSTPALVGSPWVKVMIALMTIHLLGAYAILLNPTEMAVENLFGVDQKRTPMLWRVALRTMIVIFTCTVSILFGARFPPLVELVAAFSISFTIFVFPCSFYIRLSSMAGRPLGRLELWFNLLMIALSLFGSFFGTVGAIKDMQSTW